MNQNNNPSVNPPDNDSLVGTLNLVLRKNDQQKNHCLPARVVAFSRNPDKVIIQAQPLIDMLTTGGEQVARAQIASVPVLQLGGGGIFISFALKPGDTGLLIACDRDISIFLQNYTQSKPNTVRMFDFADSFFIPCVLNGFSFDDEDAEKTVIQNLDASVKIALDDSGIVIVSPELDITGDIGITGDVNIAGKLKVTGRAIVYGDFACGGNITAVGTITPGVPIPP